jgi:hypothetical protein
MSGREPLLLEERLWAQVERQGPEDCWLWTGPDNRAGYGQIDRGAYTAELVGVHVVAWEVTAGRRVPKGLVVRHTCGRGKCCNPAHLVMGMYA